MSMQWYVAFTYAGFEERARLALQRRIKELGRDERFGRILIPGEPVPSRERSLESSDAAAQRFDADCLFIEMELNDNTFHLVKATPKITGFYGGGKPIPVKETEIGQGNSSSADEV